MSYFFRILKNYFSFDVLAAIETENELKRNIQSLEQEEWFNELLQDAKSLYLINNNHHIATILINENNVQKLKTEVEAREHFLMAINELKSSYIWE